MIAGSVAVLIALAVSGCGANILRESEGIQASVPFHPVVRHGVTTRNLNFGI
jgi:hypothetical protein